MSRRTILGEVASPATSQPLDSDLTTIAALDASTAGVMSTDGAGWIRKTYAQLKTALGLVKADVGLGSVDNTADTAKPVSTAQAAAIAAVVIPESQVTNLTTDLAAKAPLASPALTGSPTAPTQTAGDNSTKLATTAYVDNASVAANTQTGTTYTLVLTDQGKVVRFTNASASTGTVPPNSSVAFPVGAVLSVYAAGAGGTTIAAGAGVTIRNNSAALAQYAEVSLRKDATDEWVRLG